MPPVFDGSSYHYDHAVLPFVVAAVGFLAVIGWVVLMRGAPLLRAAFLGVAVSVLAFLIGGAAMAATRDLAVAEVLFRWALAPTILAGVSVMLFDLALARRLAQHALLAGVAVAISVASTVACVTTELVVDGAYITPSGIPFGTAGPLAPIHVGLIGVWVAIGSGVLWRNTDAEPSPLRRRQYRGAIRAFSVCALGVVDLALAYRIGWYPTSWLFLSAGSLLALRSLVADDLIHASSIDRRAPLAAAYALAAGVAAGWIVARDASPVLVTAGMVATFVALRAGFGVLGFVTGSDARDTPLDRALDRYTVQAKSASTIEQLAATTRELVQLTIGADCIALLLPSDDDYSWRDSEGAELPEDATPDPRLLSWLVEHARPIARDELVAARLGELRAPLERLFDSNRAEVLVPFVSRDELVGLLCLGALPRGRSLRPDERAMLARAQPRTTASIVYANMYRETHARVEVAKEVELAAAVQEAFVPGTEVVDLGGLTVTGAYAPASQCGGDWWSSHALPDGRALVLIGDVTGHGVAAAMVTAAAKGCYDVALRLMGPRVELDRLLELLHYAVRRTGGSELHMTCFATLIDTRAGTVEYANAGHVVPYVCRRMKSGKMSIQVLVARGNPLGAAEAPATYKVGSRPIEPGDVLVWYTDGVTECTNAEGAPFGDRRFQRALVGAADTDAGVDAMRDAIIRQIAAFHGGHPPADDITLVFGKMAAVS